MGDRRQMMQDYLEAFAKGADFGQYFTSDVVLTIMGTDQRAVGREAAEQQTRNMYERTFDARIEVRNLLVDDDKAAVEADFAGTHIGEFAGIVPANGRSGYLTRSSTTSATRSSTTSAAVRSARCASISR